MSAAPRYYCSQLCWTPWSSAAACPSLALLHVCSVPFWKALGVRSSCLCSSLECQVKEAPSAIPSPGSLDGTVATHLCPPALGGNLPGNGLSYVVSSHGALCYPPGRLLGTCGRHRRKRALQNCLRRVAMRCVCVWLLTKIYGGLNPH